MNIFHAVFLDHCKPGGPADHTKITKELAFAIVTALRQTDIPAETLDKLELKLQKEYREFKQTLIRDSN